MNKREVPETNGWMSRSERIRTKDEFKVIDLHYNGMLGSDAAMVLVELADQESYLDREKRPEHFYCGIWWIYKSASFLSKRLYISKQLVQKAIDRLVDIGIIVKRQYIDGNKNNSCNWYIVDYNLLDDMYTAWLQERKPIYKSEKHTEFVSEFKSLVDKNRDQYADCIISQMEGDKDNLSHGKYRIDIGGNIESIQGVLSNQYRPSKDTIEDTIERKYSPEKIQGETTVNFQSTSFDKGKDSRSNGMLSPHELRKLALSAGSKVGDVHESSRSTSGRVNKSDISVDHVALVVLEMIAKNGSKTTSLTEKQIEELQSKFPEGSLLIDSWNELYRLSPDTVRDYILNEVPKIINNTTSMRFNVGCVLTVLRKFHKSRNQFWKQQGMTFQKYDVHDAVIHDEDEEEFDPSTWSPFGI